MPEPIVEESLNKTVLRCPKCETGTWDSESGREEMEAHINECEGIEEASEKFSKGDRVKFSDFGLLRLEREQREGDVVGFSRDGRGVWVLWDDYKSRQSYNLHFIKEAGS